jgi:CheY-like chemotaxis protein
MNKTIFIIDDDPLVRLILEKMMSRVDNSLAFVHCENGKIGLEKLIGYQGKYSDCIVLLDLNMPVLDGWGFLDGIKSENLKDCQFISLYILSSSTDRKDIEKAKQNSMVKKFYHKPLSVSDISEILNL